MDKFLVKKNPTKQQSSESAQSKNMKQARLHQLGGVVVIEELIAANQQLSNPETSTDKKIDILNSLKNKKPAKEILKSTGIGKTVHYLSKHKNPAVASLASEVYLFWKTHILRILHRKPIEVDSDLETRQGRLNAKRLIKLGLDNSMIAEEIEIHVFNKCKKIMNCTYNRMVRKIHFILKNDEHNRRRIIDLECDVKEFVDEMYKQVIKVYAK